MKPGAFKLGSSLHRRPTEGSFHDVQEAAVPLVDEDIQPGAGLASVVVHAVRRDIGVQDDIRNQWLESTVLSTS